VGADSNKRFIKPTMKTHPSHFNRRQFLKLTSASAAVIGFPTILPARVLGADAPSNLIQIAQIGCGRIANDMDMPGVLKHPQLARIVAVADMDSKRAELARRKVEQSYEKSLAQKSEVKTYGDYREILARKDIDAVMISTPDHWHAQPVVEAALAGKDIYVQKPLSMTIAEGRLVSDVVRAQKRVLQIGSQQRSTAQFHRACELVRNGVIGRLKSIQIGLPVDPAGGNKAEMPVPATLNYDAWLGCTPRVPYTEDRVHPQSGDPKFFFGRPGWLRLNAYTCGMITGWGSHHVDIAHWGMGAEFAGPIAVEANAAWPGPESFWDVHGKYSVKLTYANGVVTTISDELPNGVRFEGEDGWIWVTRGAAISAKSLDASNSKLLQIPGSELKTKLHHSRNWDHHLDWLEAIRSGKEAVTNAEAGHRSCSACLIAWIGMRLGRPLKWDSEKEQFNDTEANRMLHRPERTPYGAFNAAKKAGFTKFKTLQLTRT
jgi:myo-inositol 2-dehydrogenase / D-chiro-inositol 1-dehydrogenase